jgi:hypothetical protein
MLFLNEYYWMDVWLSSWNYNICWKINLSLGTRKQKKHIFRACNSCPPSMRQEHAKRANSVPQKNSELYWAIWKWNATKQSLDIRQAGKCSELPLRQAKKSNKHKQSLIIYEHARKIDRALTYSVQIVKVIQGGSGSSVVGEANSRRYSRMWAIAVL